MKRKQNTPNEPRAQKYGTVRIIEAGSPYLQQTRDGQHYRCDPRTGAIRRVPTPKEG